MTTQSLNVKGLIGSFSQGSKGPIKKLWTDFCRLAGRFIDTLLGRRVSVVHLVEAKERFRTLKAIVTYHEEILKEGKITDENKARAIQSCRLELIDARLLLSRDQKDLNELWRILTRVRNVIMENVLDSYGLVQQLDFCREEAFRLNVTQDPVVSDMLQKLAEATDEQNTYPERIKRHVRALNERFNTIRTNRIFDQYIKMRTYRTALVVLLALSTVIIVLTPQLIDFKEGEEAMKAGLFPSYDFEWTGNFFHAAVSAVFYHVKYVVDLFKTNVLAFAFISGLIGGFFSVVLRVRNLARVAGEDAYFRLYVLSRPLIGALGAMVLYVLFMSGFVSNELVQQLGKVPEPSVFGFAFLSGFSERVVFPNLR